MIAIINSGGANIASVKFALERLDVRSVLTDDVNVIRSADKVVLPGVGAAPVAMQFADGLSGLSLTGSKVRAAPVEEVAPEVVEEPHLAQGTPASMRASAAPKVAGVTGWVRKSPVDMSIQARPKSDCAAPRAAR